MRPIDHVHAEDPHYVVLFESGKTKPFPDSIARAETTAESTPVTTQEPNPEPILEPNPKPKLEPKPNPLGPDYREIIERLR